MTEKYCVSTVRSVAEPMIVYAVEYLAITQPVIDAVPLQTVTNVLFGGVGGNVTVTELPVMK